MEIWKDVVGYEGYYQVSNLGNVRSVDRVVNVRNGTKISKGKRLKPSTNKQGYLFVPLSKENDVSLARVNRIVAQAFIPNPDNLPAVNHIDRNRTNNKVSNLEWCTIEYNNRYSTAKAIVQYNLSGSKVAEWEAISDAAKETGINLSNIAQCCRGFRKTAGNYIWRYKEVT